MTTESRPHVLYCPTSGEALYCPDYAAAYAHWEMHHTHAKPFLIATLGRVIDPSTPIIDVNE
jgi:hypothetical protein